MKLSTHGCIPKLVDFLRVNENDELLEIMGLIIARMLVSSDPRLRQLFNRHGGQQLLLSMAQYSKGLIKQEVSVTLKTISQCKYLFNLNFFPHDKFNPFPNNNFQTLPN